jgi:adenylate cyclase
VAIFVAVFAGLAAALVAGHLGMLLTAERTRVRRSRSDSMLFAQCVSRGMRRTRRVLTRIPGPPRCRICYLPFGGIGRLFPMSPSSVNPNYCRVCFERLPEGAHEMEVGALFVDIRGFTALGEQLTPVELARLSAKFFAVVTEVLVRHDAIVDSFLGDGVLALFLPVIPTLGSRACDEMLAAATGITRELGTAIPVGAAMHFGTAMVGNVRRGPVKEFCAVGDVINTAARLQERAAPGEVIVSDEAWERLTMAPDARHRTFSLRGKLTPVGARRLAISDVVPACEQPAGVTN